MKGTRTIFHSDLNAFYASVEILQNPSLRGKAVAVCGSTEERHGIVLAKSELAKSAGVTTGMTNFEAKRLCPGLVMVPPQFEEYVKYSRLAREVYENFTDKVEPYGLDECWLEVYNAKSVTSGGLEIAEQIRNAVKKELGLTVSVGASFNKVFAKLGSDMKKPDATTVITPEDFHEKVWPLPVSDLLYVGRATERKLGFHGIHTIGDIASADPGFLKQLLGVHGIMLWRFANGEDDSRVTHKEFASPVKSVGHGTTCRKDLESENEVWLVMLGLCQDISHRLITNGLSATGVQIAIKDNKLAVRQYQSPLPLATQSAIIIAQKAREIFCEKHVWMNNIRAVTVRAIDLIQENTPWQTDLFSDPVKIEKRENLAHAVDGIRERFGKNVIYPASLGLERKGHSSPFQLHVLPGQMHQ